MTPITINYPAHYRKLSIAELKKECMKEFEQKLQDKTVVNLATGASIILKKNGAKHALFARAGGFEKIVAILVIDKIIRTAAFFEQAKSTKKEYLFFIKYTNKIKVDEKVFSITVFVGVKPGKRIQFYYDHALIT